MGRVLRLGVYSFNSCEGCRHELLTRWLELVARLRSLGIEIAREPLLGIDGGEPVDIALVEGSPSRDRIGDLLRLRSSCRYLVALGTCSIVGAPPSGRSVEDNLVPLPSVVEVDAWIRGCPIDFEELVRVLSTLVKGVKPRSARFGWVPRNFVEVRGELIELRGSKCIACGRCIEACRVVGPSILNYFSRGIDTAVTTPFAEPFERFGCVHCGACAYLCPVGAIALRKGLEEPAASGTAFVELEALTILCAYLRLSPGQVVTLLRVRGFDKVVVWSPLKRSSRGWLLLPSPAEREAVALYAPSLLQHVGNELELPRGVPIVNCVSWLRVGRALMAWTAARELKPLANALGEVEPSEPDDVDVGEALEVERRRVSTTSLSKLVGLGKLVAAYLCPFECSTPGALIGLDPREVAVRRELVFEWVRGFARR